MHTLAIRRPNFFRKLASLALVLTILTVFASDASAQRGRFGGGFGRGGYYGRGYGGFGYGRGFGPGFYNRGYGPGFYNRGYGGFYGYGYPYVRPYYGVPLYGGYGLGGLGYGGYTSFYGYGYPY
jgi:hypothetical protein